MPLDAMVLTAICRELEQPLVGAKIDRISMPEKDVLVLSVHSRQCGSKKLLMSVRPGSARIHFTDQSFENPAQPPMFCMLMRKYLSGARVTAIEQPPGERMVLLHFDAVDELDFHARKTVALELMGKGVNLVLIGEDGRIIDCIRRVDYETNARRALLPGLFYQLPPQQDKPSFFRTEEAEFSRLLRSADRELPPDKWLLDSFGGLSPLLCRELAMNGWDGMEKAVCALRDIVNTGAFRPFMLTENNRPKDYSFLPIRQYGEAVALSEFADFSSMLDAFYSRRDLQESMRRRSAELTKSVKTALSRLQRKIAAREQELLDTRNREEYRRRGDLVTANIYRLKRGMESFEAQDYYQEDCPVVSIPLDKRKTPQQNAAVYYKLYNKAKTANRVLSELLTAAREEEAYLESVLHELSQAENDSDLQEIRAELIQTGYIKAKASPKGKSRRVPLRKPMEFVSDSGLPIFVGRGNTQNDELTFHLARKGDLWLHIQKLPGSHVVISQAEGKADETTLRQAATLAVTFSRAAEGDRAAVDYTLIKNVKKPSGAKPGQVLFTDYKTVLARSDPGLPERLRKKSERKNNP